MSGRARVARIIGPGTTTVSTEEVPRPGAGQLLIRPVHVGICASDLPTWRDAPASEPGLPLGHEPVGLVEAVGENTSPFRPGDWVTGRLVPSMATLAIVPACDAVAIPSGLNPADVIGEPLGCIVAGFNRLHIPTGARIAVVGAGYMGLLMTQLLSLTPNTTITAFDIRPDSLRHALASGATDSALADDTVDHDCYDIVIEATGGAPGLDLATRLVAERGQIAIVGFHQGQRQIDMRAWNWKAIDVVNAHVRSATELRAATAQGLALQAAGRIHPETLITHRFPLEEVDRAFDALANKPEGFTKSVIEIT